MLGKQGLSLSGFTGLSLVHKLSGGSLASSPLLMIAKVAYRQSDGDKLRRSLALTEKHCWVARQRAEGRSLGAGGGVSTVPARGWGEIRRSEGRRVERSLPPA